VESKRGRISRVKRYWEISAGNLSKAGFRWGCVSAVDLQGERSGLLTGAAATWDKRTRGVINDTLITMKAFLSIILAFAISATTVQAGPVRTARNVAKSTVKTAKNVAHSTVKGTRKAVHTVVDPLPTP
jgi:hypothetical protein